MLIFQFLDEICNQETMFFVASGENRGLFSREPLQTTARKYLRIGTLEHACDCNASNHLSRNKLQKGILIKLLKLHTNQSKAV